MPNTRQAYVELNFKETSRSGECNLREWNESEAVLKDVKLEGDTISYTLCAGRDTTADRITMSASISGSPVSATWRGGCVAHHLKLACVAFEICGIV